MESLSTKTRCIATTCAYCGVGCGIDLTLENDLPIKLEGTREHPANFGRLCVKGTHLLDTLGTDGRLLAPEVAGKKVMWPEAIDATAKALSETIDTYGPDSVAFYLSGQLLTEDYYVANKLMKGYIGSANVDTNSRLCMSSAVAAYKRAFGEDVVPCSYEDLDLCDVFIMVGSNAAWTHPVLFQRIERAKRLRPNLKIVAIDPRKSASTSVADMHLQILPGSDAALFNGLLNFAITEKKCDLSFVLAHTQYFEGAKKACGEWTPRKVAQTCGLSPEELIQFYRLFCDNKKVLSFYSMGINQSSSGVDKCNAIINCHLATGKILTSGSGPFSITGQPNAMGGREVGGLANQLTAHLDIDNALHRDAVQQFWQSPTMADKAGAMAVEMFEKIRSGEIKAVWIMATNPVVSLPHRSLIEAALQKCKHVIVSDCVDQNDTLTFATIKLPASSWLEKNGTVTNSERRISRQRGATIAPGLARHDWKIVCDVAKAMGYSGFDYDHVSDIFLEWACLTATVNRDERELNLRPLSELSREEYDRLAPTQWPMNHKGQAQPVFDKYRFSTPDGRARFVPIHPRPPVCAPSKEFPIILNSGRLRDQWHTMTRTGRAAALSHHSPFPTLHVHPDLANQLSIIDGDIVQAESHQGQLLAYATVTDSVLKNMCFAPIHWNKTNASAASVSALFPQVVDPLSGQPESKQVAVRVSKKEFSSYISIFTRKTTQHSGVDFWVRAKRAKYEHSELATSDTAFSLHAYLLSTLIAQNESHGEWLNVEKHDFSCSLYLVDKRLECAAFRFSSRKEQTLGFPLSWVESLFEDTFCLDDIHQLLNGKPKAFTYKGPLVCSCFKVHKTDICDAIELGANTVNKLGEQLKCGTNCGSCKSELQALINTHNFKNQQDQPVQEAV